MFVTPEDAEEDADEGCMHCAFSDKGLLECCAGMQNDASLRVDALSYANHEIDVSLYADAGLDLPECCADEENDISLRVATIRCAISFCADATVCASLMRAILM